MGNVLVIVVNRQPAMCHSQFHAYGSGSSPPFSSSRLSTLFLSASNWFDSLFFIILSLPLSCFSAFLLFFPLPVLSPCIPLPYIPPLVEPACSST